MGTCVAAHDSFLVRLHDLPSLIPAADPRLTPIGEEQARDVQAAWKREILRGVPVPQRVYCSPLTRAIRTLELTFEGVLPAHLKPVILEVISLEPYCALTNILPDSELS
jgi:broad specificity phosphatase PhoE